MGESGASSARFTDFLLITSGGAFLAENVPQEARLTGSKRSMQDWGQN